jgi:hypothetical protein
MGWLRLFRRKRERTGTLHANRRSELDRVLEDGPPLDPHNGAPAIGYWFAEQREALRGDMAVELSDAFDDLAEAEEHRRDALGKPDEPGGG